MTETADKSAELVITRKLNAPLELVWQAWTLREHISQWMGPSGFSTRVEEYDLQPGGRWRFVMIGPDHKEYPCMGVFREVVPMQHIVSSDGFGEGCDSHPDSDLPNDMIVTQQFKRLDDQNTQVVIRIMHQSAEDRRKHEQLGVVDGWGSTFECLEAHLVTMK